MRAAPVVPSPEPIPQPQGDLRAPSPGRVHVVRDRGFARAARRADGAWKRTLDVTAAAVGLAFLGPLMVSVSIACALAGAGDPFTWRERVGRRGRAFHQLVFAPSLTERPGLAREIGALLAAAGLSGAPQLWNVLIGEMSLVGPRPAAREELDAFGADRQFYLLVRPGMTGPWRQRPSLYATPAGRVAIDRDYLLHRTLAGDIALLVFAILAHPEAMAPKSALEKTAGA